MIRFKNKRSSKPKRILILGSSGIISQNLQEILHQNSYKFKVVGSSKINLKKKNAHFFLRKIIKKRDIVVFLSSEAPVKTTSALINNLEMCRNVYDGIDPNIISQLIYISSDAVYSDLKNKISEKSPANPSNLHGVMHISREKILKSKFEDKLCILRPTMIYGKKDTHNGYGPNLFLNLASKNKDIKLFGKGEEKRDHVYIDDLINVLKECIERNAVGTINLASGNVYSFKYLARKVIKETNSKSKLVYRKRNGPMPHNGYRPFDIKLLKHKFLKIKSTNFEIGIKKYIREIKI